MVTDLDFGRYGRYRQAILVQFIRQRRRRRALGRQFYRLDAHGNFLAADLRIWNGILGGNLQVPAPNSALGRNQDPSSNRLLGTFHRCKYSIQAVLSLGPAQPIHSISPIISCA